MNSKWPNFSLKHVQIEGREKHFMLIKTTFNKEEFPDVTIEISDGNQSFRGFLSSEDLRTNLKNSRLEKDEFLKMTISALTNVVIDEDSNNFSYSLQKSSHHWVIVWKKFIPAEDIKFKLGSVKLQSVPGAEIILDILGSATEKIVNLEQQATSLENEKLLLQLEKEKLFATLRDKVHEKIELENKLMSKFLLVLNAKKTKIAQLKAELSSSKGEHSNGTNTENSASKETTHDSSKTNLKKRSQDSTMLSQESESMPTTSKLARRVRSAKASSSGSNVTPYKTRTSVPKNDTQHSGNSDLECDTLDLMDNI